MVTQINVVKSFDTTKQIGILGQSAKLPKGTDVDRKDNILSPRYAPWPRLPSEKKGPSKRKRAAEVSVEPSKWTKKLKKLPRHVDESKKKDTSTLIEDNYEKNYLL